MSSTDMNPESLIDSIDLDKVNKSNNLEEIESYLENLYLRNRFDICTDHNTSFLFDLFLDLIEIIKKRTTDLSRQMIHTAHGLIFNHLQSGLARFTSPREILDYYRDLSSNESDSSGIDDTDFETIKEIILELIRERICKSRARFEFIKYSFSQEPQINEPIKMRLKLLDIERLSENLPKHLNSLPVAILELIAEIQKMKCSPNSVNSGEGNEISNNNNSEDITIARAFEVFNSHLERLKDSLANLSREQIHKMVDDTIEEIFEFTNPQVLEKVRNNEIEYINTMISKNI
ncbi:MAG: hypothetical protein MHMPM18_003107 [Marteilia pararefringens]